MLKVSVIVPTYKPGDYLWECLASLYAQSLKKENYEVVLVLNGCCDPWKTEIEERLIPNMTGMSIRFLQTDVPGVSNARNIGIEASKGKYIAFVDDDDFVSPTYLEELCRLTDSKTIALSYELAFTDGEKRFYPYYVTKDYERFHSKGIIPFYKPRRLFNGPVYKLIPREVIGKRRFDCSLKNGEDVLFMFLISDRLKFAVFSSKEAVYYRRYRKGSAITSRGGKYQRCKNSIRIIYKILKIYIRRPLNYNYFFMMSRVLGVMKIAFR